jgi:diaminopimelate epimerase
LSLDFVKLHALGNDFLIMRTGEAADLPGCLGPLAQRLCCRHLGIGADGVVFYQPTVSDPEADVSALIYNADGSKAEVSGNGLRCLAACLQARGLFSGRILRIRTVSGIKQFELKSVRGSEYVYDSRIGMPILEPERIPALIGDARKPILDYPLEVNHETVRVTVLSLGNPHCTTFWQDLEAAPTDRMGPLLESHSAFPRKTNVEFVQVLERHSIRVRFWERGVGRTLASGTGGSAAAIASLLLGYCGSPVTVFTELGSMSVAWHPGEEVRLSGPAEIICYGTCPGIVSVQATGAGIE